MQRIPQIWPGWQADELIGQGAYGKVYRASRTVGGHTSVDAIKVIDIPRDEAEVASLRSMGMDALSIRSFFEETAQSVISEVAVMESLKGAPNVVGIEDYQLIDRGDGVGWTIFIRMELFEALPQYLERVGMPDAREAAKIGADICKALAFCHAAGVIHRDVKPENVFVGRFGDYKLGDFGLARRLDEGSRSTKSQAGSGPYMAPEVVTGHYDESVDTYSLGIMLYRWLNGGRPPFIGADETPTRTAIDDAQVRRLSGERPPLPGGQGVDRALAAIVLRACEPKASDRWPSAEALGAALQTWLDGGNVEMGDWAPLDETPRAKAAAATATGSSSRDYDPLSELGATAAAVEARERKAEEREREVRMRAHAEEQRGPSPVESANEQGSREKGNADERRQERVSPQTKTPVVEVPKTSANGTPRPTGVTTGRLIASVLGVVMAGAGILDEYLKGWNEGIIPTLFFLALVLGLTYEMCLRAGSMIDALRTGSKGARTAGVVAVLVGVAAGAFGIYWATGSANNGILTYISLALGGLLLGMTVVSLFTDTSL